MMIVDLINHLQQPTGDTCESTCIAMVTGIPLDQVVKEFHDHYCTGKLEPAKYLMRFKIHPRLCKTTERYPQWDKVYIVTVPSLNTKGLNHSIVWDLRDDETPIYDPCKGRKGAHYYTNNALEAAEVEEAHLLQSYCLELEF